MKDNINQAEVIRTLVKKLLKDLDKSAFSKDLYLSKIYVDETRVTAIKYIDLKNALLNNEVYSFTEGGIIGALNTITDRVENIKKIRTKNGVYFYYSDVESNNKSVYMGDSEDYLELKKKVEEINQIVTNILRNISSKNYKAESELELEHLRKMLKISDELNEEIKRYGQERIFRNIKTRYDDLPF